LSSINFFLVTSSAVHKAANDREELDHLVAKVLTPPVRTGNLRHLLTVLDLVMMKRSNHASSGTSLYWLAMRCCIAGGTGS
jgi:hypothetical protein